MSHCKNCGHLLHHAYCAYCGQQAKTERITFQYINREIFRFFTHIEKGFLYTSWQSFVKPGTVAKNFIEGKRIGYQKPVSYFLIWTAIYVLLILLYEKIFGKNIVIDRSSYFGNSNAAEYATHYMSLTLGLLIPLYAVYLQLCGMKKYYNYFESFIAILYAQGTVLFVQVLFAISALLWFLVTGVSANADVSDIPKMVYAAWFVFDLLRQHKTKFKLIYVFLFVALAMGTFLIWRTIGFPFFSAMIFS
jgi:hypothetical protein